MHGWLVRPDGDGPHPVLLMIHGGPFAQYGWPLFDEAQVYADAGYAVVMGNPRGSSGYGQAHGTAIVGDAARPPSTCSRCSTRRWRSGGSTAPAWACWAGRTAAS